MDTQKPKKLSIAKLSGTVALVLSIPVTLFFYFQTAILGLIEKQISEIGAILIAILMLLSLSSVTLCVLLFIKNKKLHKYIDEYGIPVKVAFIDVKPDY